MITITKREFEGHPFVSIRYECGADDDGHFTIGAAL